MYREAFEKYNRAIIDSIKANPDTAVIRASGRFEDFLDDPQSTVYEFDRFVKYTVPYAPYIDSGRTGGKLPPVRAIYEWLQYQKYGLTYEDDRERWSIAWAIAQNQASQGSFKFREPDRRTRIIEQALNESRRVLDEALQEGFVSFINSEVQQEINRINELK